MLEDLGGPQVHASVVKGKLRLNLSIVSTKARIIVYKELTFVSPKGRKKGI